MGSMNDLHEKSFDAGEFSADKTVGQARKEKQSGSGANGEIPLFEAVSFLTRLHGRPISARTLVSGVARQGVRNGAGADQVVIALEQNGFSSQVSRRSLASVPTLALPVVLLLNDGFACVLKELRGDGSGIVLLPEMGFDTPLALTFDELESQYSGWLLFARPKDLSQPSATTEASSNAAESSSGTAWFWQALWRYRSYYSETAIAAVLINVLGLASSLFVMNVYDRVVPNQALGTLWVLTIGVSIAMTLEFALRCLRGYFLDTAAKKADLLISSQIFRHVLGIRTELLPRSSGNFAAQLQGFESIRDFISSAALVAFSDLPFSLLYLGVVALLGGHIVWVGIVAIPIIAIISLIIQIPLNRVVQENIKEGHTKSGALVEFIDGLETLKATGGERFARGKWETSCAMTAQSAHKSRTWSALVVNFSQLVSQLSTVATVFAGVYLMVDGKMTQGALIACVMLVGRASAPLGQIAGLMARYQHARKAYISLKAIMSLSVDRDVTRQYVHRPTFDGRIALENVKFGYPVPGRKDVIGILNIANLSIRSGERIAVFGRVGSGKSTLLKVLAGLYRPNDGILLYDGIDQRQIDPVDIRHNIAVVSQDARLFKGSLRDNLLLSAPYADSHEVLSVSEICGLHAWVTKHPLGYDLPVVEGGTNLSGGQRQMTTLARGMLMNAPIVLLDEPTSALDQGGEQALIGRLKRTLLGKTLVLVTHKPAMLELVDRIIVLEGGKIVADGPRDAVIRALSNPRANSTTQGAL